MRDGRLRSMIIVGGGYRVAAPIQADLWCHVSGISGPLPSRRLHQLVLCRVGELWNNYGVFATIGTVTSVQDPVLEVVSELQCKIADLGNACWEVGSESHNINTVTPAASVAIIWSFN